MFLESVDKVFPQDVYKRQDAERVYQAFAEKSDILSGYIVPEYEVLHTQSREYIVDDLIDVMKERGVEV